MSESADDPLERDRDASGGRGAEAGTGGGEVAASDAFGALGNETRTAVLRALRDADAPLSFSALCEATGADSSAGFAYHLRQLDGQFVRSVGSDGGDDEGYVLTDAGRRIARAMRAGAYTESLAFGPAETGDSCPFCGREELLARGADGVVTVACGVCERAVLRLPLPPGARDHDGGAELLDAFDRHHRTRLAQMADGVCPDCAGRAEARLISRTDAGERAADAGAEPPANGSANGDDASADGSGGETSAQAHLACTACGCRIACPVTLSVLDHPAVVAFYDEHGEDVRERPLWNVGEEWRERVVSEDPWCVRVSARLDDERLDLFVDDELSVRGSRRQAA